MNGHPRESCKTRGMVVLMFFVLATTSPFQQAAAADAMRDEGSGRWTPYQESLLEALRISDFVAEVTRQQGIAGLASIRGEAAQVLRLLWWTRETVPASRAELLRQWVAENGGRFQKEDLKRALVANRSELDPVHAAQRLREIDEGFVITLPPQVPAERVLSPEPHEVTRCQQLDALSQAIILTGDETARRNVYEHLPPPQSWEDGDTSARAILQLLWVFESTPASRAIVERGIVRTFSAHDVPRTAGDYCGRLVTEFGQRAREARLESMRKAFDAHGDRGDSEANAAASLPAT